MTLQANSATQLYVDNKLLVATRNPVLLEQNNIRVNQQHTESVLNMQESLQYMQLNSETANGMEGNQDFFQSYYSNAEGSQFKVRTAGMEFGQWPSVEMLTGVVLDIVRVRVKRENQGSNLNERNRTTCAAPHGTQGFGNPGGDCRTCPFQDWEAGRRNKEYSFELTTMKGEVMQVPKCEQRYQILLKTLEYGIPCVINLSRVYRQALEEYQNKLARLTVFPYQVVTEFRLMPRNDQRWIETKIVGAVESANNVANVVGGVRKAYANMQLNRAISFASPVSMNEEDEYENNRPYNPTYNPTGFNQDNGGAYDPRNDLNNRIDNFEEEGPEYDLPF